MTYAELDEQIVRLQTGEALTENEVRALCDKVRNSGICVCLLGESVGWMDYQTNYASSGSVLYMAKVSI